ncbi:TetR/AcrR family transcriptional regulator [Rhodopseudomonas palustris]|uniref:TetR/AcrR family transcriptional regulator n=1 Tax=Rhodopseudomonas palustris TaxID=1076 RepID=UPI002ACDB63A|nr:TetR/AcrR family transcriptional regulator [Rhodopseudomonas palustris]WQH00870.1 TetR/AcrR family transcriptional regulator [Rhodopseudomonas palustris]
MARVRTEAKREAILETAAEVFKERGLDGTSMSEIAKRLGGSKATLYGYFPSKEELFVHVSLGVVSKQILDMIETMPNRAADDPRDVLLNVGRQLIRRVSNEDAITAYRLAVAHGRIGNLGRIFYDAGPGKGLKVFAAYIEAATKAGHLSAADPAAAAHHLMALFESETTYRRALQLDDDISPEEVEHTVTRAVDVFLAAYGVPKASQATRE